MVVLMAMQKDLEERERYAHARKTEIDIVKRVMSKLFVGILLVSVLIGILTVIPEKVRAENWSIETVDSTAAVGKYTSIALDSNGYPHISYFDLISYIPFEELKGNLKYAKIAPTVPTPPRNLQVTPGDNYIDLKWDAPSDDGGSSITGYKIYRGTAPGGEIFVKTVGNMLIYTDDDVTNNQKYCYQVSAINSVGEGEKSNEVGATLEAVQQSPSNQ